MSSEKLGELAARKRLLLARSALVRLQIRHQLHGVRSSVSLLNTGARVAGSPQVRSALFALLLSRLGHSRAAGMLGLASKGILLGKAVSFVLALRRSLRKPEPDKPIETAPALSPRRQPVAPPRAYH